jgi:Glycosyltransferases involved in cell wall biogenesis
MNDAITFAVVIPAYNRERFIGSAIDSAVNQTRRPDEVIVVDDGSTDRTAEIARSYGGNVRILSIENNGAGPSRPRNVGIAGARSNYITVLDSDDVLEPTLLERHHGCLQLHPDIGLIAQNFYSATFGPNWRESRCANEARVVTSLPKSSLGNDTYFLESKVAYPAYCRDNFIQNSGCTFPKSVWQEVGGYDESLRTSNDYDFFLRIVARHDIVYIDCPLQTFRHHDGNISGANINKAFKPDICLNMLRVLRRELSQSCDRRAKNALRLANRKWLMDLAYGYRSAGQYNLAIAAYFRCLFYSPAYVPAMWGLAKVPICALLHLVRRTPDASQRMLANKA